MSEWRFWGGAEPRGGTDENGTVGRGQSSEASGGVWAVERSPRASTAGRDTVRSSSCTLSGPVSLEIAVDRRLGRQSESGAANLGVAVDSSADRSAPGICREGQSNKGGESLPRYPVSQRSTAVGVEPAPQGLEAAGALPSERVKETRGVGAAERRASQTKGVPLAGATIQACGASDSSGDFLLAREGGADAGRHSSADSAAWTAPVVMDAKHSATSGAAKSSNILPMQEIEYAAESDAAGTGLQGHMMERPLQDSEMLSSPSCSAPLKASRPAEVKLLASETEIRRPIMPPATATAMGGVGLAIERQSATGLFQVVLNAAVPSPVRNPLNIHVISVYFEALFVIFHSCLDRALVPISGSCFSIISFSFFSYIRHIAI